jgi:CheY-like chemotaxis protein
MEVESTFGYGTTFTIYIPIGNSHLPTSQVSIESSFIDDNISGQYGRSIVDEAERWGTRDTDWQSDTTSQSNGGETTDPESLSSSDSGNTALQSNIWIPPSTQGCRILIVDDNADMRRFVKGVLLQAYEVLEASNGQIALAMATKQQPDLILSDMNMPGLNGFELLKVLRSLPDTRSIPFMLLSANADDKARVEGLLAGADDYLTKPFSPRELILRVHTLLDNARMRIQLEKRVREVSKYLMESEERFR